MERGNGVEGVIRAPAGTEEAGWIRDLKQKAWKVGCCLIRHAYFVAEIQFHISAPFTLKENHISTKKKYDYYDW